MAFAAIAFEVSTPGSTAGITPIEFGPGVAQGLNDVAGQPAAVMMAVGE